MVRLGKWKIDLPDYFVARYFYEFLAWARLASTPDFPCTRLFVFNEGDFADWSPDREQGKVMPGAWLLAKIGKRFVECEAYSELDRDKIRNHCKKLQSLGVRSRDRLAEPERPGIPVIPFGKGNGHAAN
jgi:hypothetical protein